MLSLAIETSSPQASVALMRDGGLLGEASFAQGLRHAAGLLPAIDDLLRSQGVSPRELNVLQLSIGPGSFTGLRIGVTLAKTLAFSLGIAIVPVPTLETIAQNAPAGAGHIAVMLDARRGKVYAALFERRGDGIACILPAHLTTPESFLAEAPKPIHILGDALIHHAAAITTSPDLIPCPPDLWIPTARNVARLGANLPPADPITLTPLYLRMVEAEEKAVGGRR